MVVNFPEKNEQKKRWRGVPEYPSDCGLGLGCRSSSALLRCAQGEVKKADAVMQRHLRGIDGIFWEWGIMFLGVVNQNLTMDCIS